ncbi:hypothetical protein [Paraburkholderia sp. BL21I4N1]|uniref:hypothetical protein n=1 Tax=Paraburkholderia sp. BL21I4N1 TaxID=1938801 RepID=UPI000CFBC060|nr:hypothetical protein [Paraburkholderia sp. BL21I4N1]PQV46082.1 hypothetical protein B0G83_11441 [Paraburkholderia sp. BL21I4N1]
MNLGRLIVVVFVAFASMSAGVAYAQTAAPRAGSSGAAASATKPVCVDAEVDGQRALSYDCLSSQLKPKPAVQAAASRTAAEAAANAPSNRVGTFNLSTERNRFGANWGNSVTPQRPAAPVAVPPK